MTIRRLGPPRLSGTDTEARLRAALSWLNDFWNVVTFNQDEFRTEIDDHEARISAIEVDQWKSIPFPAASIVLTGAVADPDRDTTTGGLLFDASATELCVVIAPMPSGWKEGTPIRPHVQWEKTTSAAGTVLWQIDYLWAQPKEIRSTTYTSISSSTPHALTPDTADARKQLITAFGEIAGAGLEIGDTLLCKVARVGGSDTYAADALMVGFNLNYQADTRGSVSEFAKASA